MRIALFATASLLAIAGAAMPAAAQYPYDYGRSRDQGARAIEWRLDMIYQRIESARTSGRIAPGEARGLHATGQSLYNRYSAYRRNGLDRREYAELAGRIADLRRRIQWALGSGYDGRGNDDRWGDRRDGGSNDGRYDRNDGWDDSRERDWNDDTGWDDNIDRDDRYGEDPRDDPRNDPRNDPRYENDGQYDDDRLEYPGGDDRSQDRPNDDRRDDRGDDGYRNDRGDRDYDPWIEPGRSDSDNVITPRDNAEWDARARANQQWIEGDPDDE